MRGKAESSKNLPSIFTLTEAVASKYDPPRPVSLSSADYIKLLRMALNSSYVGDAKGQPQNVLKKQLSLAQKCRQHRGENGGVSAKSRAPKIPGAAVGKAVSRTSIFRERILNSNVH